MNILLDLDGVLADFFTSALFKLNRITKKNISPEQYRRHNTFNMAEVFQISTEEMWSITDNNNFWLNLEPFPWAKELLNFLSSHGEVTICTSPSHNPDCARQKTQWIDSHLDVKSSGLMVGSRKYLMARHDVVLIDDYHKNVEQFFAAGGKGVVVPSNWNHPNLTIGAVINTLHQSGHF